MIFHASAHAHPPPATLLAQYYWLVVLLALVLLAVLAARLWWTARACRPGRRYEYRALREEGAETVELENRAQHLLQLSPLCQRLLTDSPRYQLLGSLPAIGSRIDKQWFLVTDTTVRAQRLVSIFPQNARWAAAQKDSNVTRRTLLDLFLALHHPYLSPVLDVHFQETAEKSYVVIIQPPGSGGSLKDLIYGSCWQEEWDDKYSRRGTGLETGQIQRLGRQILEAVLFLYSSGFPVFGHLHSGNVVMQNGVARVTGFENAMLEHTSRVYPLLRRRVKTEEKRAIDTLCFGHVLFEMCSGFELSTPHPTSAQLLELRRYPQVTQALRFIFEHPEHRYPTVEEVVELPFFRNLDLRELRCMPRTRIHPTLPNVVSVLRQLQRRHHLAKRRSKSASAVEAVKNNNDNNDEDDNNNNNGDASSLSWSSSEPSVTPSPSKSPSKSPSPSKFARRIAVCEHRPIRRQNSDGINANMYASRDEYVASASTSPLHFRARDCLGGVSVSPIASCWRTLPMTEMGGRRHKSDECDYSDVAPLRETEAT